jgi:hypothetical protein
MHLAPNRESKISKFNFDAYAVLEANATQSSSNSNLVGLTSDVLTNIVSLASGTKQDPGRKNTAQPIARGQDKEDGYLQFDASTPFRGRAKHQLERRTPLDAEQFDLPWIIQFVGTADFLADQDSGHCRCRAPVDHNIRVRVIRASLRKQEPVRLTDVASSLFLV